MKASELKNNSGDLAVVRACRSSHCPLHNLRASRGPASFSSSKIHRNVRPGFHEGVSSGVVRSARADGREVVQASEWQCKEIARIGVLKDFVYRLAFVFEVT